MTPQNLAPYVLAVLHAAQSDGRAVTLQTLVDTLQVRRGDLRATVTALHRQGALDVRTMRLTMLGFALGAMYASQKLPPLRRPKLALVSAA